MALLITLIAGISRPVLAATLEADYQFNNTLSSSVGTAPALTNIGPGINSFATETVDDVTRRVLTFPTDNGLQLAPTTNTISNNSYSVVMLFRFADVSGYNSIVDFKNGADDYHLYNQNGILNFW
jgi:hypothetical protein